MQVGSAQIGLPFNSLKMMGRQPMKAIKKTGQMGVTVVKKTGEAGVTIVNEVEDAVQSNYRKLHTTVARRKNRTNKSLIESDDDDYNDENDPYGSS